MEAPQPVAPEAPVSEAAPIEEAPALAEAPAIDEEPAAIPVAESPEAVEAIDATSPLPIDEIAPVEEIAPIEEIAPVDIESREARDLIDDEPLVIASDAAPATQPDVDEPVAAAPFAEVDVSDETPIDLDAIALEALADDKLVPEPLASDESAMTAAAQRDEVIDSTQPTPESVFDLEEATGESRLEEVPIDELTDTGFGRDVQEFVGERSGPLVEPLESRTDTAIPLPPPEIAAEETLDVEASEEPTVPLYGAASHADGADRRAGNSRCRQHRRHHRPAGPGACRGDPESVGRTGDAGRIGRG